MSTEHIQEVIPSNKNRRVIMYHNDSSDYIQAVIPSKNALISRVSSYHNNLIGRVFSVCSEFAKKKFETYDELLKHYRKINTDKITANDCRNASGFQYKYVNMIYINNNEILSAYLVFNFINQDKNTFEKYKNEKYAEIDVRFSNNRPSTIEPTFNLQTDDEKNNNEHHWWVDVNDFANLIINLHKLNKNDIYNVQNINMNDVQKVII